MSKNRKLFDELMSGIDAMRQQREGKITLRTHEVDELPRPEIAPELIRATRDEDTTMRTIGRRKEPEITFSASAELLAEGARFSDEIHRLPTGSRTLIRKGVYRFQNHAEANRHELDCLVEGMAKIALERR